METILVTESGTVMITTETVMAMAMSTTITTILRLSRRHTPVMGMVTATMTIDRRSH
jgi:hypothetical protein